MTGTCDRCHRKGKLFRIPWTGDHLCKDCIDQDSGLQQMFAEVDSMVYDQHLRDLGIPTDLPEGMDTPLYIIEPGTFTGKAPFAGITPNGRHFSTTVMNFYSFDAEGKIIGDVAATGIAGILQGIGALP